MNLVGKNSLSNFMRILIIITMGLTVVAVGLLPWIVDYYLKFIGANPCYAKKILLIMLYPCGILSFLAQNELRRIFKTLANKDPFVKDNVKSLRRIAIYLLIISACFIFKIVMMNSIMTMIGTFGFIMIALLCFILADVFNQAVIYKMDNDLTI